MKCLILAAGYATRLYPITENFPKPLLKVGEKTILDWLVDDIDNSSVIDEYVVISNHRYVSHFETWATEKSSKITVIDDGTETNETRLGAVCDIDFAIKQLNIQDDVLVIAGDNVLDFSLTTFISYAMEKGTSAIMRYHECRLDRLRKSGVVSIDENDLVIEMQEKPPEPKSEWCAPPFYYYTKSDSCKVAEAIAEGCGTDAPGSFIAWLCKQSPVHAMEMPGKRYDIGNIESYSEISKNYKGIIN